MHKQESPLELIHLLGHKMESIADRFIYRPMKLSSINAKILFIASRRQAVTPGELMQLTNSSKSNISQRLNVLEKEGLVKRHHASTARDGRVMEIMITEHGREKLREINKYLTKAKICLDKRFTQEELRANIAFLQKLLDFLSAQEKQLETFFHK